MDIQNKTKEELLKELQVLKQKNAELTATCENVVAENKQEDVLLQQTRKNYETFFNTINDFLFVLDEQGNIIHTNSTVTDRLGYTQEELSGLSVLMVHPPERREEAGRIVGEMLSGVSKVCPIPIVTKSGIQIPVETRVSHGFWDGKPVIFGVTKDISKVKLSEEKFSKVFYLNPSACGLSDLDTGEYLEVNDQFYTLLGFDKNEVIGKTAIELGILTQEAINAVRLNADSNGNITNVKADLKTRNGDIKHVLLSAENIIVQDKKYRYTIVHDITELKQAEQMLLRSEAKHSAMILNISDVIGIIGADGLMKYKSPNIEKWFGWQPQDLVGTDGWLTVHPDDLERIQKEFFLLLEKDNSVKTVEYRYKCKNGSYKPIELTATNLVNDPVIGGVLLNYHDITERKLVEKALQESEERFKRIFENKAIATGIFGEESILKDCNAMFAKMSGYSKSEIIDKMKWSDFVVKEDLERLQKYHSQRLKNGNLPPSQYECSIINKSGELINVIVNIALIGENRIVSLTDITERKQLEEALRESEERFNLAITGTGAGLWDWNMVNNTVYFSPQWKAMLGYEDHEIENAFSGWKKLWHPDDVTRIEERLKDYLDGKTTKYEIEHRLRHKDGDWCWILTRGDIIKDYDGKPSRWVGTNLDITERKKTEEKVREKDIQFRKLSANVSDLIFQFTRRPDGTYYVPIASEGIRNIFGCSPEDVLNDFTPIGKVIYPDDAVRVISDIEYSAKHLTYFTCEFRVQIPGKAIQWIYSKSNPEKLPDGSITWYGFNADITERKQTEEALEKSESHLSELNATKDRFFSIIAHDLKSPFNSIIGFSNLLVEQTHKKDNAGIEKYAEIIQQSSNRAMDLLMNLMEWAQSQTGRMEYTPEYFELVALIKDTTLLLSSTLEEKSITLTKNVPSNATVFADKKMISTVLRNLISNAIKFTHTEGEISIAVEEKKDELLISISDNGVGIAKASIDKLFKIDQTYSTTGTNKEKGTGLGLILCKEFIEKHEGNIWAESEEGKGSTFYFTLPKEAETKVENDVEKIIPEEDVHNHINQEVSGLKILITDDDDTSQQLISIMVQMFSKELLHAQNGIEALDACHLNPDIDLILMDMKMPKMGGLESTRQIRKFNKEVIIIAQTAFGLPSDREKAIESGCNDYISKPINKTELLALIQKHFKK